jgi:dTDP-D-glucose 4,6-dehydratase
VADIGHIHKTLGFKPEYAFEKGLEITFEWYIGRKNL